MGEILNVAEALWTGETDVYNKHPFGQPWGLEKVADGFYFFKGFSNAAIAETSEGLVIVDPGGLVDVDLKYKSIREEFSQPLNTAVYTHGHVDHVFGVPLFEAESDVNQGFPVRVAAHELLPDRLMRYIKTAGWNSVINTRQFRGGAAKIEWPVEYRQPDITYNDRLDMSVGGVEFMLRHCKGETDDHTWVFFHKEKVLCTGDLFIYAVPNAGNPQKVQRYAGQWARGLREMAALNPEILLPGHGFPIIGADRVREALLNTARLLDHLETGTISLMNQGASLDRIIHEVGMPEELSGLPYLQPVYDEPEFIVRNIYRLYGGWYDGQASRLKPAPEAEQALEIARLAGGARVLADRASELAKEGNFRLACHLADWAIMAEPENKDVLTAAGRIYKERTKIETSTMAMGIFLNAARECNVEFEETSLSRGQITTAQVQRGAPKQKE